MTTLTSFLNAHRVETGEEWNLTGMASFDKGRYFVGDDEYDDFLSIFHNHVFGRVPKASSLLEKHKEAGPPLIDFDARYEMGGPLVRRFTADHVRDFIAHYIAAMLYFSKVESLPTDLEFYHLEKPAPETDRSHHKDGVHIQCPSIATHPRYQYCIRGFLLSRGVIGKVFGSTGFSNAPEDFYDVSVIHKNNWFLYGACKPDKPQYKAVKVWRLAIADLAEVVSKSDPTNFDALVESVRDRMTERTATTDNKAMIQLLSIRRNHTTAAPLDIRASRTAEWEALLAAWGSGGKAGPKAAPARIEHVGGGSGDDDEPGEARLIVTDEGEDGRRVNSPKTAEDIALAYRLSRECVNAPKRLADYHDWVKFAILLKNIANTDESRTVWMELSRRATIAEGKPSLTDAEFHAKWKLINVDGTKNLSMASLVHWAKEDNPDKYRSIQSETDTLWIINFAKDTHVSVASFVCRRFQHEFRCSPGGRKGSFEWYQYVPKTAWKYMKASVELRARLSGTIKNDYVEAGREVSRKYTTTTDEGERERYDALRKKLFGIERQLEMSTFKDNVLRESLEKFYDEDFMSRLNANPYLVGVANGVLDLRYYDDEAMTGRPHVVFRPGLPDDNISFQMGRCTPGLDPISYVPYIADSPEQKLIAEFFERIYPDPVLRKYVLVLLASCLEGRNAEQKFYVMQGPGSNGKSIIEKLMELVFGDYGTAVSTAVFTRKRPDSGNANPDLITVKCRRYIHMGEPDDDEKINTSIMKAWSGGDRIAARGLFEGQDNFVIMGKPFLSCNYLPAVNKMDGGTWRRLRVIPHNSVFKDPGDPAINPDQHIYPKDLDLENKLVHWRTAFLSLLVHLYDTEYIPNGLREPDCVLSASNKYKEENDLFMAFFGDCYVKEAGAGPIVSKAVRERFNEWKKSAGRCDLKLSQVYDRMRETCGSGSTDKEFWGVREAEDADSSTGGSILLEGMP